jgi:hypothetical protein
MKLRPIIPFAALFILIPWSLPAQFCGDFPAPGFDGPDMSQYKGRYSNGEYGYAVTIPKDITGYASPPPSPNHGFGIVLSWEPRSYIYFDGSYTLDGSVSDQMSLNEVEEWYLGLLRKESEKVLAIKQVNTQLGSLPAKRHIVDRTCKGHNEVYVADEIFALRPDGNITYSAVLLTTRSRYKKDKQIFESLLQTWKINDSD